MAAGWAVAAAAEASNGLKRTGSSLRPARQGLDGQPGRLFLDLYISLHNIDSRK